MEKQTWRAFTARGGCVEVTVEKSLDGTWTWVGYGTINTTLSWGDTPIDVVLEAMAQAQLRVVEIVPPGELSREEMKASLREVERLRAEVEGLQGLVARLRWT